MAITKTGNLLPKRIYPEAIEFSPVNVGILWLSDVRLENPLENVERDTRRAAVPVHLLHQPLLHHGRLLLRQLQEVATGKYGKTDDTKAKAFVPATIYTVGKYEQIQQ